MGFRFRRSVKILPGIRARHGIDDNELDQCLLLDHSGDAAF